jgi:hypothetical protein
VVILSDFGEEIINRLPDTSSLHITTNPGRKVIDTTIGEWLTAFDDEDWFNQFFLDSATGPYLDVHGKDFNVKRKLDETDEDYRQRIIYETIGHLTINFLKEVYGVELYTYVPGFDATENTLISDNPYICSNGFLGVADSVTRNVLDKKFVVGSEVTWL